MTRLRMTALAALTVFAVSLGAASTASAQDGVVNATKKVALTGTKGFEGTFTIDRFANKGGKLVAIGTVNGTMRKNGKTRTVRRSGVRMPASVAGAGATAAQLPPPAGGNSCQILNLVIGPINLNLLGLIVRTNQIELRIDAQRGPGNLLGNLLCAVAHLLDQGLDLGGLLAQINAILGSLLGGL
jgi:hypothetical protein